MNDALQFTRVTREGHLFLVTLARPQVLNSLHAPACFELDRIFTDFRDDPEAWVCIIHGEGRSFCAGHDLAEGPDEPMPASGWAGFAARSDLDKPIIAAVHGHALGGGFEIALACDIVIADETAKFALSEPRIGGIALGGGAHKLARRMPPAIAMGYLLTGRTMDAREAERWGLVNEVAPAGEALAAARRWADEIVKCAPIPVRHTKRIARAAIEDAEFLAKLGEAQDEILPGLFATEDTKEGIAAFLAKRAPEWKGR